jgi:hypothetical protein
MRMNLFAQETWIDATQHVGSGSSDVYETFSDDPGELFRAFQREYGRCTGSVFVDKDGTSRRVGWVFQKRARYTDTKESYLMETWVTLHTREPVTTVEHFPFYMGEA